MPGLTASLAVAAAATLAVHPVAHPAGAVPEQAAAEPCVIILPLDPGSDTQLQDLLRELLAALEKLVGADGDAAPGDPPSPAAGGTDCPASTGRTGNADDAPAPGVPAPAPPSGQGPGADDPTPNTPDAGDGDTGGTDQGDASGDSEVGDANRPEADSDGSGPGGSGRDDAGGEDSAGEASAGGDASQGDDAGGDDAGGDDAGGDDAGGDDPGGGASAGDTSTDGGEDDDGDGGSGDGGEANDSDRSGGGSGDEGSDAEDPAAEDADVSPASASDTGGAVQTPGDLLDLQNFFLTLPVGPEGDPDSIDQPELLTYSSEHFQLTPEGDGVVFRAPAGGVTTENSKYPRSELREMNGEEKAAWSNTSGTHVLETRQAITQVPPAKPEVVAAQIHDGGDDVMQIRLEGQTLVAQYADGEEQIVIDPAYELGTPYDLRIVAADGRVTVFYDGEQRAEIARSGSSWYFKIGAYTQSNPERGDSPDAVGEVVVYSLSIEHTGA